MRVMMAALLCGLVVAMTPGTATADDEPGNLVLIGDSLSSVPASAAQGRWFTQFAAHVGLTVQNSSDAGSGILMASHHCAPNGKTFGQLLGNIERFRPEMVIVEDGINDRYYCRKGRYLRATDQQIRTKMDTFMGDLAIKAQRAGVPRDKVLVVMPHSYKTRAYQWVLDHSKKAAARHRFTFLTPYLTVNQTTDGFHPNQRGQDALAAALIAAVG